MARTKLNRGFTLLELLVSLAIFSLVAVTVYSSLTSMVSTREHLDDESEELRTLQTALRIIGRDIEQAVDRPVRSAYDEELSALRWQTTPVRSLQFTTNGRRNPAGLARSSLQRVSFRIEDSVLIKDAWPVLDRAVDSKPFSRKLLDGVIGFDISFVGDNEKVLLGWPPEITGTEAETPALPRAVNVQLDLKGWGKINRLFLIGGRG